MSVRLLLPSTQSTISISVLTWHMSCPCSIWWKEEKARAGCLWLRLEAGVGRQQRRAHEVRVGRKKRLYFWRRGTRVITKAWGTLVSSRGKYDTCYCYRKSKKSCDIGVHAGEKACKQSKAYRFRQPVLTKLEIECRSARLSMFFFGPPSLLQRVYDGM